MVEAAAGGGNFATAAAGTSAAASAQPRGTLQLGLVACLSGLLFGYDTSCFNAALPILSREFGLSALAEGVVAARSYSVPP